MTFEERKALVQSYLGKTVSVKIDRPIEYVHHKKHVTLHYPINYGYLPGVLGGDGEELDVYVLGIDVPVDVCSVCVIGIVYRENDVEDKLIAAPEGMVFDQAQIASAIHFQEQYYRTAVEALFQKSCGAVLYRKRCGVTEYLLLLQRRSQTWSFPKGHMEAGETEKQTALREVREETGLDVVFSESFRETVEYRLANGGRKQVVLFLAETTAEPDVRAEEIEAFRWCPLVEVREILHRLYGEPLFKRLEKVEG